MSAGWSRRRVLKSIAGAAVALPFFHRFLGPAAAATPAGQARRVIFFYFPDGVAGPSQDGQPSLWHPTGTEHSFTLPAQLEPLTAWRDRCVFLRGLSMGPADSGSHPGGAKKLLTGVAGGNGQSVDQYLAQTVGAAHPFRHLYLGAMATQNGASGDKHISYVGPGQTVPPIDDPAQAFAQLFAGSTPGAPPPDHRRSVIDAAAADLADLRAGLDGREARKLDLHLESLREVETRIDAGSAACGSVPPDVGSVTDPAELQRIVRAQADVMVQAMACDLTRVGVLQLSHHTSELIMSRIPGTDMYDPAFDMRSHQASHYGPRHDDAKREFRDYVAQRRWFVAELAHLLEQLDARPEGEGTMLDHTLVVLCTEVCDGNTHLHDDMPFVLAGGAGGALRGGRLKDYGYRRHGDLLAWVARTLGASVTGWGDDSSGPLDGLA